MLGDDAVGDALMTLGIDAVEDTLMIALRSPMAWGDAPGSLA